MPDRGRWRVLRAKDSLSGHVEGHLDYVKDRLRGGVGSSGRGSLHRPFPFHLTPFQRLGVKAYTHTHTHTHCRKSLGTSELLYSPKGICVEHCCISFMDPLEGACTALHLSCSSHSPACCHTAFGGRRPPVNRSFLQLNTRGEGYLPLVPNNRRRSHQHGPPSSPSQQHA